MNEKVGGYLVSLGGWHGWREGGKKGGREVGKYVGKYVGWSGWLVK